MLCDALLLLLPPGAMPRPTAPALPTPHHPQQLPGSAWTARSGFTQRWAFRANGAFIPFTSLKLQKLREALRPCTTCWWRCEDGAVGRGWLLLFPTCPSLPKGRGVQEQGTATSARAWGDIWAWTRVWGHTQGCRARLQCPEGEHAGTPCFASTYVHAGVTVCMQVHACAVRCTHSWYLCSHQAQGGSLLESMPEDEGRGPGLQELHTLPKGRPSSTAPCVSRRGSPSCSTGGGCLACSSLCSITSTTVSTATLKAYSCRLANEPEPVVFLGDAEHPAVAHHCSLRLGHPLPAPNCPHPPSPQPHAPLHRAPRVQWDPLLPIGMGA